MIVVESMFFDSDDYQVQGEVIPCDSKETAKAVVKKVYDKLLDDYDFDCEDDPEEAQKEWEEQYVTKHKDGSIDIEGSDCGYGWIRIVDRLTVTADTVSSLKPVVGNIY
jgi:3-phosphoglycerate kinase